MSKGVASKGAAQKSTSTKQAGSKTGASRPGKSEETKLRELFVEELKDLYYAEKLLLKTMPKLAKAATSEELRMAYQQHITESEGQVERLNQVFEQLGMSPKAKKCEAMTGLVQEAEHAISDTDKGTATRDAALIISSQKAEHYEIASYGSLMALAKVMGENQVAQLLSQNLQEEKNTDEKLSQLAESTINIKAEAEPQ
ncbi:hypothetical protein BUE76_18655 [Cnuella takakiae]|nr:hypothetical protein BUE76_18655 [Cnuella takakiae]